MTFFDEQYLDSPIVRVNLEALHKKELDEFFDFIAGLDVDQFKIHEERTTHEACVFALYKGVPVVEAVRKILYVYAYQFIHEFLPELERKGVHYIELDSSMNANTSWHGFSIHRHYPPYYMDPIDFTSVLYGMVPDERIPGKGSILFWRQSQEEDNLEYTAFPDTIEHDLEYFPRKYDLLLFTPDIWHQALRSAQLNEGKKLNRYAITIEMVGINNDQT